MESPKKSNPPGVKRPNVDPSPQQSKYTNRSRASSYFDSYTPNKSFVPSQCTNNYPNQNYMIDHNSTRFQGEGYFNTGSGAVEGSTTTSTLLQVASKQNDWTPNNKKMAKLTKNIKKIGEMMKSDEFVASDPYNCLAKLTVKQGLVLKVEKVVTKKECLVRIFVGDVLAVTNKAQSMKGLRNDAIFKFDEILRTKSWKLVKKKSGAIKLTVTEKKITDPITTETDLNNHEPKTCQLEIDVSHEPKTCQREIDVNSKPKKIKKEIDDNGKPKKGKKKIGVNGKPKKGKKEIDVIGKPKKGKKETDINGEPKKGKKEIDYNHELKTCKIEIDDDYEPKTCKNEIDDNHELKTCKIEVDGDYEPKTCKKETVDNYEQKTCKLEIDDDCEPKTCKKEIEDNLEPMKHDGGGVDDLIATNLRNTLGDFVLVNRLSSVEVKESPILILKHSAHFSKKKFKFVKNRVGLPGICRCVATLEGIAIGEGAHRYTLTAKQEAARVALDRLRSLFGTLQIRPGSGRMLNAMNEDGMQCEEKPIGEDNMGNKLLQKMGWTGGGLGKDNKGMTIPVKAHNNYGRKGFGQKKGQGVKNGHFKRGFKSFREWRRDYSPRELVNRVKHSGGEMGCFKLLPPCQGDGNLSNIP